LAGTEDGNHPADWHVPSRTYTQKLRTILVRGFLHADVSPLSLIGMHNPLDGL